GRPALPCRPIPRVDACVAVRDARDTGAPSPGSGLARAPPSLPLDAAHEPLPRMRSAPRPLPSSRRVVGLSHSTRLRPAALIDGASSRFSPILLFLSFASLVLVGAYSASPA
ncbi:unnamed protein product, partial [Urochloa humidicola]